MSALNEDLYAAAILLYEDSQYEEAIAPLKQAADGGHLLAAEKLANCYKRTGSPELALPYWEICRKANNHSANTNYAGYLKEFTGQQDLAMELWRNAAEAGIPQAAFNLGVWLKNSDRIDEGKTYLKKSGDLGYLDGYFVLAGIFYRAEEWDQAKEALAPLMLVADPRAETMMATINHKLHLIDTPAIIRRENPKGKAGLDWI
jgi:TPR repeat protein